MKRGSTFVTLDLFETQIVIDALDAQIKQIDELFRRLPRPRRLEMQGFRQRLMTLRDRLKKRFDPAIDKLRQESQAPIQREHGDAR